ncbi:attractin-like protein 1 isoform X5 [Rousettus aegyptiacus]|uniref:attractin-like protein 1 isoform X5 n=1 Tax=Rousettus aegyptiacus TaxID=9407 RepID=UPI00168D70E0|nr:attractin-like protein 1 isoform X5 [Rousettus aegyptiacus]
MLSSLCVVGVFLFSEKKKRKKKKERNRQEDGAEEGEAPAKTRCTFAAVDRGRERLPFFAEAAKPAASRCCVCGAREARSASGAGLPGAPRARGPHLGGHHPSAARPGGAGARGGVPGSCQGGARPRRRACGGSAGRRGAGGPSSAPRAPAVAPAAGSRRRREHGCWGAAGCVPGGAGLTPAFRLPPPALGAPTSRLPLAPALPGARGWAPRQLARAAGEAGPLAGSPPPPAGSPPRVPSGAPRVACSAGSQPPAGPGAPRRWARPAEDTRLTEPSGYLTDGPINYKYKTKCTWLIEGYPNAVLRLRFNHFATECSWDHMYVYDGDSIYAPLIAVLSGLIVPEIRGNETVPEVVTTSGYALLHFFSDAAYNLTGFNIFYSINSCPNNCSGHGKCTTSISVPSQVYCECDKYWKGEACDIPYCKANCGSPDHGYCDLTGEKLCVCNDSWQGPDCSLNVPSTESYWILPNVKPFSPSVGRASHKAVLHGKFMWVIGGYTFNYSSFQMVLNYNLENSIWNVGTVSRGPLQRYGHSLALYQENIFMYGGRIETNDGNVTDELWVFNIRSQSWSTKTPTVIGHGQQYAVEGHSAHIMELDSRDVVMIIIFGYSAIYGYSSSIQEYHISSNTWLVPETKGAIVQGGYGHTSVYDEITKSIYVHGGYKALPGNKYGLVDDLYKYEVNTKTWTILKESGFARYLHSAVLINGAMLIFGGNTHNDTSLSNGAKCFSADFLAYDIACDEWKTLPKPNLHRDVNRFGHSAVVINGSMYIFGGFSSVLLNDILVYKPPNCRAFRDEELCKNAGPGIKCIWTKNYCESWESGNTNNILRAKCPPKTAASDDRCYRYADCASCTANTNGCQWCDDKKCISANSNCSMSVKNYTKCHVRNEQICNKLTSCKSCSLNLNCQWDQRQQECQALPAHLCGEGWNHIGDACLRINSSRESYDNAKLYCYNLSGNLASLTTSKEVEFVLDEIQKYTQQKVSPWVGLRKINISYWGWEDMSPFTNTTLQWLPGEPNDSGFCAYLERAAVAGLKANPCTSMADGLVCEKPVVSPNQNARPCKKPCSLRTSCSNCTSNGMECMWCSSTRRCVDSNAYIISFPYGQCLEWQTATCSPQNCSGLRTCGQCLEQPGCGWCNDPSNTGRGHCIEGSSRGPMKHLGMHNNEMVLDTSLCPKEKHYEWSFIQCPACQCNGHSTCINHNVCEHCKNLTTGKQCQDCMPGYYGDPTNGGQCTACTCSGHANICHMHTGKCFCTTKGIKGDQCQLCDSENRYVGNPLRGTCYYSLLIDYQFTFSLLQEDDRHYTAINFIANPEQSNKNLDISINASNNFNLNITWSVGSTAGTISGEETPIVSKTNIKEYRDSFSYEKFNFRSNPNITFYVYVSNFSWPIKIQIAFSQHNTIMDLVQFFVTFFSCFLSLLLVAAVVWKIKQTCWASRRREQLLRERQQMASRPFASVDVALEVGAEQTDFLRGPLEGNLGYTVSLSSFGCCLTRVMLNNGKSSGTSQRLITFIGAPKPIATEPCAGNRAAVLTVFLCLPRGSSGAPPPGQSATQSLRAQEPS